MNLISQRLSEGDRVVVDELDLAEIRRPETHRRRGRRKQNRVAIQSAGGNVDHRFRRHRRNHNRVLPLKYIDSV